MIRKPFHRYAAKFAGKTGLILIALLLPLASISRAQDAVRPSLAGEAASEARRQSIDRIPYNLMMGPVRFRFSATAGIEYNDNVNLAEHGPRAFEFQNVPLPQEDFIFRPQVNVNALWPVTQLNTLRFDLGLGYAFYLNHSEYNTTGLLISPGSQIAFDIFVTDFRINFHDRFSLQQDPISQIGLSNVANYGRFQNTVGVSVLWDLNKAVLTLGYDHYNYISTTSRFDYLNRNAEILTGSLSFAVTSTTGVGVESSFVATSYDQNVLNDSNTYSAGLFVETQLTNYLKLRAAGGYQAIDFENTGRVNDANDVGDYYANVLLSHRLNSVLTHSLALGHESQLGVNSNYIRLNYARHTATWNILYHTLLSTELFYEDARASGGLGQFFPIGPVGIFNPYAAEHIHRYGGAVTVGYQMTKHITLGLRYQYTQKDSDLLLRDYRQNRVAIDGTYSF